MTDEELRTLVREAVARRMGRSPAPGPGGPPRPEAPHASHALYLTLVNATDACLIEPSVACTHCGYCQSHGY